MIDICDFAVGLSRQLHGLTMHSERPQHRMYEQYHPLGVVGIISAFTFSCSRLGWEYYINLVMVMSIMETIRENTTWNLCQNIIMK
jgi:aldehyde dehydrogenase (NAD+)